MSNADILVKRLTRIFSILASVAVVLFGVDFLLYVLKVPIVLPGIPIGVLGLVFLMISVFFGVALPILMRTLFQTRAAKRKRVGLGEMESFQVKLVVIPLIAAYSADLACLFIVPNIHLYGSVLCALYGIYSAIPVRRKILADLNYYGLKEDT